MKRIFKSLAEPFPSPRTFNLSMLFFRIAVSLEMIVLHGFKKLGFGVRVAEKIPNPLHLSITFNNGFAIAANAFFPVLLLVGFCTRLATLPILAVTLIGYFVLHWNDTALTRDTPFIYSAVFLMILFIGPGKYSFDYIIYKKYNR